jgi:hypothetical protein
VLELHRRWVVILPLVVSMAACETTVDREPYYLVAPDTIAPSVASPLSRWDSRAELQQWVENPWTEGPYSLGFEDGVEFAHVNLRPGVSSALYGPNLQPPFEGLRSVRVRVRYSAQAGTSSRLNLVDAHVVPTVHDPANSRVAYYYVWGAATPDEWQVLELQYQDYTGYPPVVDARWVYIAIGRAGEIGVDIDWIELVR